MAGMRQFRLLNIPIILGVVVGMAYMIYATAIYLGPLLLYPSHADYAPKDLILNRFDPHGKWPHDFAVSPVGKEVVAADPGRIYWIADWDDQDRIRIVSQELGAGDEVCTATYSGDGTRVVFFVAEYAKHPGTARIAVYDARTRKLVSQWPTSFDLSFYKPMISQNGTELLTECDGRVEIRKANTGELLRAVDLPEQKCWVNITSHERLVFVCCDDEFREYRIFESEKPYTPPRLVSSVKAPAGSQFSRPLLSADGSLLAVSAHPTLDVNVFRVSDGQQVARLDSRLPPVRYAFSPSGTFLAISYSDDTVAIWRIESVEEVCRLRGLPFRPIRYLDFGPDDKTLITRDAKATVVWDISRFVN